MITRRSLVGLAGFWAVFTALGVCWLSGSFAEPRLWILGLVWGVVGWALAWFFFLRSPLAEEPVEAVSLTPSPEAEEMEEVPPALLESPAEVLQPELRRDEASLAALSGFLSESRELLKAASGGTHLQDLKVSADFIRENVQRTFEISDNLAGTAQQAFTLSEKVQNGVTVVTDALAESMRQSQVLFDQSKRIVMILEMMSDVSEKIHVLSINASIVSARAGALGRGFDVVAKEIRALAKETEHSLKNIEEVISDLQKTINDVIVVVKNADAETEQEKNSLITVAGSLQGVILGVEIIRAVSAVVKEKAEEEATLVQKLVEDEAHGLASMLDSHLADWEGRVQALNSSSFAPKE
ncbi:MAG: hypothetical protein HKM06_04955 [Spirochaetales bacterium]|nr:hypothetical protein [Spirochaetales bacterium]